MSSYKAAFNDVNTKRKKYDDEVVRAQLSAILYSPKRSGIL